MTTYPNIGTDGITIQSFQDIYDELEAGYKGIYGDDINLDADSPDGQRIGIEAQARLDLQSYALALYNQLDPDFAVGEALNRLVKFSGIIRNPSKRSTASVTIVTDRNITLESGYTVADTIGQNWITTIENTLTTGSNTTSLVSELFGAYEAGIGTITEPVTIILGITSVTNPSAATVGEDEETDEALRIRRNFSLVVPQTSTIGGMYTALANLQDVTKVKIYENDQDTEDTDLSIDPHTIWVIVEGAEDNDIAQIIAETKTGGTGLKGSEEGTYVETLTKPDGTEFNYTHTANFDRTTDQPLYIELTVTRKDSTIEADVDGIKDALAELTYDIAEDVQASELYSTVLTAGDTFVVTDLEISLDDTIYTDGEAEANADGIITISTANITVTEVV